MRQRRAMTSDADAVVFDLDGVLVDSETIWDDVRRAFVERHGGTWLPDATRTMMGMSAPEWSAYMHDRLGIALPPGEIAARVAEQVEAEYRRHLPLLPGAAAAVTRLAAVWPLGLASSSNRTTIESFLDISGLRSHFAVTVSSEEVEHGKPAPDVYLEAVRRLRADAVRCAAIEDSTNGLLAAAAAQLAVVAVPNRHFPPSPDALARTALVVESLDDVTPEQIAVAVRRHVAC